MTSPLCWAASTNVVPAQDQIATSSKAKGSQDKAKRRQSRGKGAVQAWLPLYSKKGPIQASPGKSFVHTPQVAELQKKIQLLGKMAPEGIKWPGDNSVHPAR